MILSGRLVLGRPFLKAPVSTHYFQAHAIFRYQAFRMNLGIQSVPAVIFDSQHLVTGAQEVENYTNILRHLALMKD